ncbi:hypothetical protein Pyn_29463 [Prunus yedoensis var. nudiflora]|uniref:Uncharacterized protein n=1 Tax=Prunus yedoensis var. nudiflora TaxID=2094558 RepID=A0A314UH44_PRUYE|nr:hypothetical protein Pyn_29463 [Prunus yedoensis var. nudiflora]
MLTIRFAFCQCGRGEEGPGARETSPRRFASRFGAQGSWVVALSDKGSLVRFLGSMLAISSFFGWVVCGWITWPSPSWD